jgi:hypothetical protein
MNTELYTHRRRPNFLIKTLMVVTNVALLLGIAGLTLTAMQGGKLGLVSIGQDANQQIVKDYLAQNVLPGIYRVRQWYPAETLDVSRTGLIGHHAEQAPAPVVAQRVTLMIYGPRGARQVDSVYWIQDGHVTRSTQLDRSPLLRQI